MELFWLLVVVVFIGVEISASRRQKIYDRDGVYVRTKIEGKTYWLRMDLGYGDPMPKVGGHSCAEVCLWTAARPNRDTRNKLRVA